MIRLSVMSDIHVEKGEWEPAALDADLVVLAGDVGWGLEGVAWIARWLGGRPTVYVAGNREYWHHPPGSDPIGALRRASAAVPNLHFLQDETITFDMAGTRLRVLGATLWGDFSLDGDAAATMERAAASMPDYRHGRGPGGLALTPADALAANRASVSFLSRALADPHEGPNLVVTHHVPSERSLRTRKPGNVPQAASVTALDGLIEARGPDLWIHGHTHTDCDYTLGRTRVLTHQRGGPEGDPFAPMLVMV